jgi:type IX secretion system PorP/SprF family membrane protein
MKRTLKLALGLALVTEIVSGPDAYSQDVHFSQFYENALMRNPGLVGIFSGDYRVTANYRSQWSGLAVPFITYTGSAEFRITTRPEGMDYLSFGLTTVADHAGSINFNSSTTYLGINYSKNLNDDRATYLSAGFAGGFIQRSVDPTKMTFANQYNSGLSGSIVPDKGIQANTMQHFDVAAGVSLNGSFSENGFANYYLGIAGYHLHNPKEAFGTGSDFITLTPRYTASAGLRLGIGPATAITLHSTFQYQLPHKMLLVGGLIGQQLSKTAERPAAFSAGCFLRLGDAIIPSIRIDYRLWSLLLSYDVSLGDRREYLNGAGGTELSFIVRGRVPHRRPSPLRCPRFEEFTQSW